MCPHVVKLGNNPYVKKIDSPKFLLWGILAEEYNNLDHPNLRSTFARNNNFYELVLILEDIPRNFDMFTPIKLSQLMAHINDHYQKAVRKQQNI
jgi:hypothetical protein